jgi:quercetin dioxygenase-like cupin family protein
MTTQHPTEPNARDVVVPSAVGSGLRIIESASLPGGDARDFLGTAFGVEISMILLNAPPGDGPSLHCHDYAEVIVVLEGQAELTTGGTRTTLSAGQIAVIDAGQPHGFVNRGPGLFRSLDIHLNHEFATTWLDVQEE